MSLDEMRRMSMDEMRRMSLDEMRKMRLKSYLTNASKIVGKCS